MNFFPLAFAAEIEELTNVKKFVLNPIIALLFTLAIVYFMYGVVRFIYGYAEKGTMEEGKKHLLWGTVGLTIMVSVYGLMNLLTATIRGLIN
jgi:hypothetical protein